MKKGFIKGALHVNDPWGEGGGYHADQIFVNDRASHSTLLGSNGKPIPYEQTPKVGFDLSIRPAPKGCK
jgi:hypothetical protein